MIKHQIIMSNIENNNPMTVEEVARLKTVKAKSAEKSANVKLSDKEPEMEKFRLV